MAGGFNYRIRGSRYHLLLVKDSLWKAAKINTRLQAGYLYVNVKDASELVALQTVCNLLNLQYEQF